MAGFTHITSAATRTASLSLGAKAQAGSTGSPLRPDGSSVRTRDERQSTGAESTTAARPTVDATGSEGSGVDTSGVSAHTLMILDVIKRSNEQNPFSSPEVYAATIRGSLGPLLERDGVSDPEAVVEELIRQTLGEVPEIEPLSEAPTQSGGVVSSGRLDVRG